MRWAMQTVIRPNLRWPINSMPWLLETASRRRLTAHAVPIGYVGELPHRGGRKVTRKGFGRLGLWIQVSLGGMIE